MPSNSGPEAHAIVREVVVLIHGFFGSRLDMVLINRHLKKVGFGTSHFCYSSIRTSIPLLGAKLATQLESMESDNSIKRFHLVAHSMGGIVARAAFENRSFQKAGRVVTLTPPNRGSHIARRLGPPFGWLFPSLPQISDDPSSYVNNLGTFENNPQVELGIVRSLKDRVIAQDCVQLAGCNELIDVGIHHGVITWYSQAARLAENFIRHGTFGEKTLPIDRERLA